MNKLTGWICPCCQTVYSPYVEICKKCTEENKSVTVTQKVDCHNPNIRIINPK